MKAVEGSGGRNNHYLYCIYTQNIFHRFTRVLHTPLLLLQKTCILQKKLRKLGVGLTKKEKEEEENIPIVYYANPSSSIYGYPSYGRDEYRKDCTIL